jgi:uncharacterized membrane protein HdeD (DUF308 family)
MFKSTSTWLILLGVLSVIVGIIAITWPSVTIAALVALFAVYAFIAAGLQQGIGKVVILGVSLVDTRVMV